MASSGSVAVSSAPQGFHRVIEDTASAVAPIISELGWIEHARCDWAEPIPPNPTFPKDEGAVTARWCVVSRGEGAPNAEQISKSRGIFRGLLPPTRGHSTRFVPFYPELATLPGTQFSAGSSWNIWIYACFSWRPRQESNLRPSA
jgi:hypothetical protein